MGLKLPRKRHLQDLHLLFELLLRIGLLALFVFLEHQEPFFRKIHKEEAWLYANPMTQSYLPASMLWPIVALVPAATIIAVFLVAQKRGPRLLQSSGGGSPSSAAAAAGDAGAAFLCASLALTLNGVVTDVIKLSVGRPRPDFLQRCWPGGSRPDDALFGHDHLSCTGDPAVVIEGRKSFPSGHSSFSFAAFGFVFFYVSGKMRTFSVGLRGRHLLGSIRLVVSVFILLVPVVIAISRTCDYHHHWQDVTAGSVIGFLISWTVYRFYYPSLNSLDCDKPYFQLHHQQRLLRTGGGDAESAAAKDFFVYG